MRCTGKSYLNTHITCRAVWWGMQETKQYEPQQKDNKYHNSNDSNIKPCVAQVRVVI